MATVLHKYLLELFGICTNKFLFHWVSTQIWYQSLDLVHCTDLFIYPNGCFFTHWLIRLLCTSEILSFEFNRVEHVWTFHSHVLKVPAGTSHKAYRIKRCKKVDLTTPGKGKCVKQKPVWHWLTIIMYYEIENSAVRAETKYISEASQCSSQDQITLFESTLEETWEWPGGQ